MEGEFLDNEGISSDIRNNCFESGEFVSVDKVPEKFKHVFSNYMCFNRIQSAVFNDVFETDASLVVSAPTGSGKTVVFELAITRLMRKYDLHQTEYNFMIIYVAPIKALCEERMLDWHKKFSSLGISCISVTGDSDVMSVQHLFNHNLIITTPEKWDSLTRRWRNSVSFINRVVLFMIDEVHLLNDESRGPTLEAIMSRMKTIEDSKEETVSEDVHQKIRFLAISATIPNVEDIAEWIGTRAMPAKYFNFSDEARPVKLMKIVQGYYFNPQMSTPFKFDIMLSYKLQGIILQYSNGKPTLIFCSTRKSVEMTSKHLSQNLTITLNGTQKSVLQEAAAKITTPGIREILIHGVGSHHAGMLPDSRRIVESLFRNGDLPILVTTSTLAMGINLPAHLVIIKSTKYYTKGEYKDYSESVLFQMIGRAGRPQFDTFATAVILTTSADKSKFENMIGGTQCIESSLHKHLTEHLNAEIVLRTITETGIAKQWLTSTFLHIRARKHPSYYGFSANLNQDQLDKKFMEMCQIEINKLERVGMIVIENSSILPTEMGSLMAKFCVHFETMKLFKEVQGTEILQQILSLISRCHEFSDLYLRVNDKKTLNLLNKCKNRETIRFPFSGKIKTLDMKINCIIQAVFGCLQILEPSLVNESQKIMRIGERISKCLADYLETKENCYSALLNALILAKCFHCRIWENSPYVSKQLSGIGAVMSSHLVQAGKISFQSLLQTNPRNLEMIIHRKPPMGDNIISAVQLLPQYKLKMEETKISPCKSKVKIFIQLVNYDKLKYQLTVDSQSCIDLVVGDDLNNILLHKKYSHSFMIDNPEIEREIPSEFYKHTNIHAHLICENLVGIDCKCTLELYSISKETPKQTPRVTKLPRQPKKLEQMIESSEKPHVKNYINQYFKIAKKMNNATPPKVQNSPIVEKTVTTPKSNDFDENNLLESDQELGNWEPLDENLLGSPEDLELSAAVDVIESESSYLDALSMKSNENASNLVNQEHTEVIKENSIKKNATDDEETKSCTSFEQDFHSAQNINGELKKPIKKFQFKKRDANEKIVAVQMIRNEDFFSDEMVNEFKLDECIQSNTTVQEKILNDAVNIKQLERGEDSSPALKDTRNVQKLAVISNSMQPNKKQDNNQSIQKRDYGVNSIDTWKNQTVDKQKIVLQDTQSINRKDGAGVSIVTPIIENLRGLITNKNNSFRNEDYSQNNESSLMSEDESDDPDESFSSTRSAKPLDPPTQRVESFMNNIKDVFSPQYPTTTDDERNASRLSNQNRLIPTQCHSVPRSSNHVSNYVHMSPPQTSSRVYDNRSLSVQRGEHYTDMGNRDQAIGFNSVKDVKTERNRELGMVSFSNLFNKEKLVANAMNYEREILANEQTEISDLGKFSYTPKKRYSHTITSNSKSEADSSTSVTERQNKRMKINEFSYATQPNGDKKSIKWRNPLIVSPKVKYSPKNFDRGMITNLISQGSENLINSKPQINFRGTPHSQPTPKQMPYGQDLYTRNNLIAAQSSGYQNPPHFPQRSQTVLPTSATRLSKRRTIPPSNFPLKTPKSVQKFPVADQDCGYRHSTQFLEDNQRSCNELNNFFSSSAVEVFKPEGREMNFVESDIASYVLQNQPEMVPTGHGGGQEWWNPPAMVHADGAVKQEWWNQPENNEDVVKEELQREIKEMFQSTITNPNSQNEDPRFLNLGNQGSCCNHCTHRNPLQSYNYQNSWPNVPEIHPNTQPVMYENCPPTQWDFGYNYQQMNPAWDGRTSGVNPNGWPMINTPNHNPEHPTYNNEYRWDLMQRYLNTQSQQTIFKDK